MTRAETGDVDDVDRHHRVHDGQPTARQGRCQGRRHDLLEICAPCPVQGATIVRRCP